MTYQMLLSHKFADAFFFELEILQQKNSRMHAIEVVPYSLEFGISEYCVTARKELC